MNSKIKAGLAALIILSSGLVGCSTNQFEVVEIVEKEDQSQQDYIVGQKLEYSNLVDIQTQDQLTNQLMQAGISKESIQTFFDWVNDYNNRAGNAKAFKEGFTTSESSQVDYDDIFLEERVLADGNRQIDVNCRMTAFLLFKDFVDVGEYTTEADNYLMFDIEAIDSDSSYQMIKESRDKFITLFNPIDVDKGVDVKGHIQQIQEEWVKRGVRFKENQDISLITLFMHDNIEDKRFVGHTGVVVETEEGIMLLEKYSSDLPFQYTKFNLEQEMVDYILSRKDIYGDGTEAKPIVMRNDKVIS